MTDLNIPTNLTDNTDSAEYRFSGDARYTPKDSRVTSYKAKRTAYVFCDLDSNEALVVLTDRRQKINRRETMGLQDALNQASAFLNEVN